MELVLRHCITSDAAVIVVNYRPAVMSPVMPFEFPMTVAGSMLPAVVSVPFSVRCAIVVSLVEFGLETVCRSIVVMITLGMITPTVTAIKFVSRRFIPFLKMVAAIPMTFTAPFALSP